MGKVLKGNYKSVKEAEIEVHNLLSSGCPKEKITVVTERRITPAFDSEGIKVERNIEKVEDLSLWEKIRNAFSSDDSTGKDPDEIIAEHKNDLKRGHLLVLMEQDQSVGFQKGTELTNQPEPTDGIAKAVGKAGPIEEAEQAIIKLHEEKLSVETTPVQTGEVKIEKVVTEEMQTVEVPVKKEELVIKRTPVNSGEQTGNAEFKEEEITIPLMEEQVQVKKTPTVTEEVLVEKKTEQETIEVKEAVRKEELEMKKAGDAAVEDETSTK